jgi:hypothetical protein
MRKQEIQHRHSHFPRTRHIPQSGGIDSRLVQKTLDAILLPGQPAKAFQGKNFGAVWGHGFGIWARVVISMA